MSSAARDRFPKGTAALLVAWAALIALMLSSWWAAAFPLGIWNLVIGLAIAVVKTSIVVWLFMRMRSATVLVRIVALVALGTYGLIYALTAVDYATRHQAPAVMQPPQVLVPLKDGGSWR
jgi:cytochrome c oxidase subunit 4